MGAAMSSIPAWKIERSIMVRAHEDLDTSLGFFPEKRPLSKHIRYGMLVVDKPPGPTSHEVVAWVKRLLELDKAGHGGTLDPRVTGVLPVGLQDSTKVVQALLASGKEYICVMKTHSEEDEGRVGDVLKLFEGLIYQRPPVRASVKRRLRTRRIYSIEFLEGDGRNWLFKVACESGTYIRKLCYDVGEVLGYGAHMHELRRIRSGPYTEADLVSMFDLVDAVDLWKTEEEEGPLRELIRPLESSLILLPKIWIRDSAVDAICTGAALMMPGILSFESGIESGNFVAVLTQKGEGVALMKAGKTSNEMMELERGLAATPLRVIMPRGTYPRMW